MLCFCRTHEQGLEHPQPSPATCFVLLVVLYSCVVNNGAHGAGLEKIYRERETHTSSMHSHRPQDCTAVRQSCYAMAYEASQGYSSCQGKRAKRRSPGLRKHLSGRLEIWCKTRRAINENNRYFLIPLPLTVDLGTRFFVLPFLRNRMDQRSTDPV